MQTIQSQLNILAKAIYNLYTDSKKKSMSNFELIKIQPDLNGIDETDKTKLPAFMLSDTYSIGLTISPTDNLTTKVYKITPKKIKSTLNNEKYKNAEFEYYVPGSYELESKETKLESFFNADRFRQNMDITNSSATILFHLSDIIPTPTSGDSVAFTFSNEQQTADLLGDNSNTEIIKIVESSSTNEQSATFGLRGNKPLEDLRQILHDNNQTCVDVVDENFKSILYANVYEKVEENVLKFKEYNVTKHKKPLEIDYSKLDNIYILETTNNKIYDLI